VLRSCLLGTLHASVNASSVLSYLILRYAKCKWPILVEIW
jgi:hypothetical protein